MDLDHMRRQARQRLRAHGPATVGELARELGGDAGVDERDLSHLLLDVGYDEDNWAAFPLLDGRLCDLDTVLDGITLTHVLQPHERTSGTVAVEPDLTLLELLFGEHRTVPLVGTPSAQLERGDHGLTGPDGWLPDDDLLVLRVIDGQLEVSGRAEVPATDATTAERLARTLEVLRERHEHPIDEAELLLEARARYPHLLSRPQAPLEVLFAAEDLVSTDSGVRTIAEAEDDGPDSVERLSIHLHDDHGLDEEQVDAVLHLLLDVTRLQQEALRAGLAEARQRIEQGEGVDIAPVTSTERAAASSTLDDLDAAQTAWALAVALDDVDAALALLEDVIDDDALAAAALFELLDAVRPARRSRTIRANTAWVRARALELTSDDHAQAEHALRQALDADPDHGPAAFELAGYLSMRGRAGAAIGQLRAIEGPGVDELIDLLADFAQPGPMSAERNEPCPCGSGRKHKVCCAVHGGWSLADRMPWVMHKLMSFYGSPYARDVVLDVAGACSMAEEGSDERDVAVLNLALFEGGLVEDLCEVKGALLPADELDLLRGWAQVRGRLYELVERSGDGAGVLLDLRSGERTAVIDHSLTGQLELGTAMLAWLVTGPRGTVPFYGAVVVPDAYRQSLLDLLDEEPTATQLGRWVRDLHAPPRLATTGGDPMVSIEQTFDVPDPASARTALAAALEADEDGTLRAYEERDGHRWLKGTVHLDGGRLVVETLSAPRAAWFADLIAEVVPDATLVDEQRLPLTDLLAGVGADGDLPEGEGVLDGLSDGDRAAAEQQLATFMRQHEDTWVDSPLPALDGASPRQALDDPTRRDVVVRLLEEFERAEETWPGPGRGMSAARLRDLLGL